MPINRDWTSFYTVPIRSPASELPQRRHQLTKTGDYAHARSVMSEIAILRQLSLDMGVIPRWQLGHLSASSKPASAFVAAHQRAGS